MSEVAEDRVAGAVSRAVNFLGATQMAWGEFPTYWSECRDMSGAAYAQSPFVTGMIILALSSIPTVTAAVIRRKGIAYLLSRRRPDGFFSFFDAGMDCDLDDTCLLNWAIQTAHSHRRSYAALAKTVARLPRREGFYETWVRNSPTQGNDIDPCVNVNVIRFLDRNGIRCDQTVRALRRTLLRQRHAHGTLYYESGYALPYLILTLPPKLRDGIAGASDRSLLTRPCRGVPSVLDRAMRLYILSSCGVNPEACAGLADELLALGSKDGEWSSWACFRAFNFWGSTQLNTAIVAQALQRYQTSIVRPVFG